MINQATIDLVKEFEGLKLKAYKDAVGVAEFGEAVGVHLMVYDHDDLRGALRKDSQGRTPRGDLAAVQKLVADSIA